MGSVFYREIFFNVFRTEFQEMWNAGEEEKENYVQRKVKERL